MRFGPFPIANVIHIFEFGEQEMRERSVLEPREGLFQHSWRAPFDILKERWLELAGGDEIIAPIQSRTDDRVMAVHLRGAFLEEFAGYGGTIAS